MNSYENLCFIIVAKEEYKIKLFINDGDSRQKRPDFEFVIYDGTEEENHLLTSFNWLMKNKTVQTREYPIATILIRKTIAQSITDQHIDKDVLGYLHLNQTKHLSKRDTNSVLLNITWLTSLCPDDQMLCGGHFQTKCYTKEQRCDGKLFFCKREHAHRLFFAIVNCRYLGLYQW